MEKMNMKKKLEKPQLEVIRFDSAEDIIVTSNGVKDNYQNPGKEFEIQDGI